MSVGANTYGNVIMMRIHLNLVTHLFTNGRKHKIKMLTKHIGG